MVPVEVGTEAEVVERAREMVVVVESEVRVTSVAARLVVADLLADVETVVDLRLVDAKAEVDVALTLTLVLVLTGADTAMPPHTTCPTAKFVHPELITGLNP